jgi:hypothetical protein
MEPQRVKAPQFSFKGNIMDTGDWRDPTPTRTTNGPYHVQRTPSGSVVICRAHVVTEEVKDEEARALASALNNEHAKRNRE